METLGVFNSKPQFNPYMPNVLGVAGLSGERLRSFTNQLIRIWPTLGARTGYAPGPAGSHALSGSWREEKVNSISANGLTVTYKGTPDGLQMSDQNGDSYDAKFDGKDYPINGDPGHTMVSLKRIGGDTIEETNKRAGKVIGVLRMTVSKDGKTIQAEYTNKERATKTSFVMEKKS